MKTKKMAPQDLDEHTEEDSMTKDVAVQKTDVAVQQTVETTATDVAVGPAGVPAIQAQLAQWCKEKQTEVEREHDTLFDAITKAKEGGFRTRALDAAYRKVGESMLFYEKVMGALECGYMLFPPIQGSDIEILAIRSEDGQHGFERTLTYTGRRAEGIEGADILPAGEGSYVSPNVHWIKGGIEKVQSGTSTVDRQVWYPSAKLNAPEFPLVMARSQCVEATNRAMVELVFDDIAIYPANARKDPVILGRIYDPNRNRWLNFLISWRVDKRDI